MEVCCGQCNGRLLIETPGVVVACPHCGVHLMAPPLESNDALPATLRTPPPSIPEEPQPKTKLGVAANITIAGPDARALRSEKTGTETIVAKASELSFPISAPTIEPPSINVLDGDDEHSESEFVFNFSGPTSPNLLQMAEETPQVESPVPAALSSMNDGLAAIASDDFEIGKHVSASTADSKMPVTVVNPFQFRIAEAVTADVGNANSWPTSAIPQFQDSSAKFTQSESDADQGPSTTLLIVVGTYASLLTIYVVYMTFFMRSHQLESLPDLKTIQQEGGRAAVPRPENDVPPGHLLALGQSQRYGNIKVTPLRITRGPIEFRHFTGDLTQERPLTEPVLKLWLRFENVSHEQTIVPIDPTLMFFRRVLNDRIASYNVIFRELDRKQSRAKVYYPFDRIALDSEWQIVGQNLNQALAPHGTMETFVPSQEQIDKLSGDLVWRVHIRKGHGMKTGNGVTTLIDVRFQWNDVQPDSA